ncbi:MAG: hypothetical protein PHP32_06895 [Candidatus Izemoplasmatales bacterium]|nr:hypothetical protein [Candidatus Izemoplasmatales bacterium]
MPYLIAGVVTVLVVVLFVVSYRVNEQTKVPEGCEDLTDMSGCATCSNGSCSIKRTITVDEKHVG